MANFTKVTEYYGQETEHLRWKCINDDNGGSWAHTIWDLEGNLVGVYSQKHGRPFLIERWKDVYGEELKVHWNNYEVCTLNEALLVFAQRVGDAFKPASAAIHDKPSKDTCFHLDAQVQGSVQAWCPKCQDYVPSRLVVANLVEKLADVNELIWSEANAAKEVKLEAATPEL